MVRNRILRPMGERLRLGVPILLRHAEVDNVDHILALGARSTDQEVVGLDVSVDQILLVNCLYPCQLSSTKIDISTTYRGICGRNDLPSASQP